MIVKIAKKTARIAILLMLALIVVALANSLYTAWYMDYFTFTDEKNRVLERAKDIAMTAANYDEQKTLAYLGNNPHSGDFYRLDDHIHHSIFRQINNNGFPQIKSFTKKELNFQKPDNIPLQSNYDNVTIRDGIFRYGNSEDNVLKSTIPLEIHLAELGSVEIRMKLSQSRRVYFGWTSDPSAKWDDKDRVHYMRFFAVQDGQFHNYSIDGAAIADAQKNINEPIRKIFLLPEAKEYVELSHIRFNGRMKPYVDQGCGTTYEKINNETRKSMFVESGYEVDFEIDIPKDRPYFSFGVGAVNPTPISISVILKTDDQKDILLSECFSGPVKWHDYRVDLDRYQGKQASLLIRSKSKVSNALLISSPIVRTPFRKPFNAMLVIEDSLRADRLSCYGYDREISPVKDQWADKGVLFSNAFSQESFTRASCASFLTSLYPGATGVWTPFDVLNDSYTTLPEVLRSQGFATLLITQIVNVSEDSGLHQGFDRILDFRTVGDRASGIYGSDVLEKWLSSHADQNKFVYLHIFDPHHPYDPPAAFAGEYYGQSYIGGSRSLEPSVYFDPPWLTHPTIESRNFLYDEEIRYNDGLFQNLLDTLKTHGIYEDTLVVFTSDHGEFLGEHNLWGHIPPNHRQVLHVPMIMVYPSGLPKNTIIEQPVQLLDIMPTILDIAEVPTDGLLMQGDSLLPLIENEDPSYWNQRFSISDEVQISQKSDQKAYQSVIYKNYHIVTTNAIYDPFRRLVGKFSPWLHESMFQSRFYNLETDPDEYRAYLNLFADLYFQFKMQRFATDLRQANLALWYHMTLESDGTTVIDTDVLEQLRSLGYVD